MLKWFRKYEKYILVLGVSVLMLIFLVEPAINQLMGDNTRATIGTVGGRKITVRDQQQAANEMDLLKQLTPIAPMMMGSLLSTHPIDWILLKHEAQQMGLGAGTDEIEQVLQLLGLGEQSALLQHANAMGVSTEQVRQVIRTWITLQKHEQLVNGQQFVSAADQLKVYRQVAPFLMYGMQYPEIGIMLQGAKGLPRVSTPVMQRFALDQFSQVTIEAVMVSADRYINDVPAPDEKTLAELFDKYRDKLPGEGEPHGLGYKLPDRIKLEYAHIPAEQLQKLVNIEEADALTYYEKNRERFSIPADTNDATAAPVPRTKPYVVVRQQIIRELKREKAGQLGRQIGKAMLADLLKNTQILSTSDGYRVLPEDFKRIDLESVAQSTQQRFGVLPAVLRHDADWLSEDEAILLSGIGTSQVVDRPGVTFIDYAFSTKELENQTSPNPTLTNLRLQQGLPSMLLEGNDGSIYLFRVLDVSKARVPESLDEVRGRVTMDARRLAAYEKLLADRDTWTQRVKTEGLDAMAEELGTRVIKPDSFSKLTFDGNGLADVPGIGRNSQFLNSVFDLAQQLIDRPADQADEPVTGVVPFDADLTLVLVKVVDYEPLPMSGYEDLARGQMSALIQDAMNRNITLTIDRDALSKRVGWTEAAE